MMSRKLTVFTTAVVLLLLICTDLVQMTSDPASRFCRPVCWEENILADQCEADTDCDRNTLSRSEYRECIGPCFTEVSSCQMMCRTNFHRFMDECVNECTDINVYEGCMSSCFTDRALTFKHDQLRNLIPPLVPEPPPLELLV